MIKAIEIENFKGIGERIRIPIRPLTLLFGPNSGGKSSVLHALHFLREVLVHRRLDVDTTEIGGDLVSLGGFTNFVHKCEIDRVVSVAVEMDFTQAALFDYVADHPDRQLGHKENEDLSHQVKTVCIELGVKWSHADRRPMVMTWKVSVNGQEVGAIEHIPGKPHPVIKGIGFDHVLWEHDDEDEDGNPIKKSLLRVAYSQVFEVEENFNPEVIEIALIEQVDALPRWGVPLTLGIQDKDDEQKEAKGDSKRLDPEKVEKERTLRAEEEVLRRAREGYIADLTSLLSQVMVSPGEELTRFLQEFRYLGPLRKIPSRRYLVPKRIKIERWADGMAAWDRLASKSEKLANECRDWLVRIGSGYGLKPRRIYEVSEVDPFLWMLTSGKAHEVMEEEEIRRQLSDYPVRVEIQLIDINTGRMLAPQDVGVGISQVVPVIVAACDECEGLTLIEQPELHLHPAIQVNLGDLLASCAIGRQMPLLVETHSEHILLRILRRIREQYEEDDILPPLGYNKTITPDHISVVYLWQEEGQTKVQSLEIDEKGEFKEHWPHGFFEERAEELF